MIHNNVRSLREAKGISQSFIAEALNMSRAGYHSLETGRTELRAEMLKVISTALDVPVEIFFDDKLTKSVIRKLKRRVQRSGAARRKEAG